MRAKKCDCCKKVALSIAILASAVAVATLIVHSRQEEEKGEEDIFEDEL